MTDVPGNAPDHCPGTESETAGKAAACAGCPNQSICSSLPKGPDPVIEEIKLKLANVKHKIVILSGKGGVGKSTFTAQLAHALSTNEELQIGVLDVDICGPSMPRILGVEGEAVHQSGSGWSPVYVRDNLAMMSVGFLLGSQDDAVIWRGAKKSGMIKQFLRDVDWDQLDYLLIDTPPGTSDEHLSLVQFLSGAEIDGVIIITTPQDLALSDVRKEMNFCRKVSLPIIGLVENMSEFVCPKCHQSSVIFPPTSGGASALAQLQAEKFLGRLPLDPRLAQCCDQGTSFLEEVPDSPASAAFRSIVDRIVDFCGATRSNKEKKLNEGQEEMDLTS